MIDSWWLVTMLGVISASLMVMAWVLWTTAREARGVLRQLSEVLPHCQQAVEEVRRTLHEARQLLARTHHTVRQVDGVVEKACGTALEGLGQLTLWKDRLQALLTRHNGTATGSGRSRRQRGM